jgi:molybdopterin synthase sulfur carrier subunit
MGCDSEAVVLPDDVGTIAELIDWLAVRNDRGAAVFADPSRIRAARDGVMAGPDSAIAGAAEISLFPPVTGG